MKMFPDKKRILGIDFGQVRIGIAVSDELGLMAHPVETIPSGQQALPRIAAIAAEKDVECVVVGLPLHMNGQMSEAAEEVLAFVDELRKLLPCKVVTWDERLTTTSATRTLRDAGQKTRKSRMFIDQVAAQHILQGYLDRLQSLSKSDSEGEPDRLE